MKKQVINLFVLLLICIANLSAQTDFMPIGATLNMESSTWGKSSSRIYEAQKDTIVEGLTCRKITIFSRANTGDYTPLRYFLLHQRGDSIFLPKVEKTGLKLSFQFKNKYNIGDSMYLKDAVNDTFAVVFIDSMIESQGVKRYASRLRCLSQNKSARLSDIQFNLYDKFMVDSDVDFFAWCNFSDYTTYLPLCYRDSKTFYTTPYFTGSCKATLRTEVEGDDIKIFPNPADGYFSIQTSSPQSVKVSIRNINRLEVVHETLSTVNDLTISQLPSGIYFIQIEAENGVITHKKIIVRH